MAWTAPSTHVISDILTAATMNAQVRDNFKHLRADTQAQTGAATLVDGSAPIVLVNFSAGAAATLNLPAAPSTGQRFLFMDVGVCWATKALTIGRNGKTIDYATSDIVVADTGASYELVYNGTGWITTFSSVTGWTRTGTDRKGLAEGAFRSYLNSAFSPAPAGFTVVPFDAEEWDVSGWHDAVTNKGRFTPLLSGVYRLSASVTFSDAGIAAGQQFTVAILKNAAVVAQWQTVTHASGTLYCLAITDEVKANGSTDFFDIRVNHASAAARAVSTGTTNTYFAGQMIGKTA